MIPYIPYDPNEHIDIDFGDDSDFFLPFGCIDQMELCEKNLVALGCTKKTAAKFSRNVSGEGAWITIKGKKVHVDPYGVVK